MEDEVLDLDDPIIENEDEPIVDDVEQDELEEEPEAPATITRDDVYQYLQNDPEELQRIARIANAALEDNTNRSKPQEQSQRQASPLVRPRLNDFIAVDGGIRVEEYDEAVEAYENAREAQSFSVIAPAKVSAEADRIAASFDVPESAKEDLKQALGILAPQALLNLTDNERLFLARTAEGIAAHKARTSPSKSPKPHVERSGSVSAGTWKPADGQTKGDVDFYCSITGRDINNKTDREHLKKEGLIA